MGINLSELLRGRLAGVAASAFALAGIVLLVADAIADDQAMMLGGFALIFFAVTLYFIGFVRMPADSHDFWESVAWGKMFVGLIYASIAIMFLVAFFHSPELAHALRRIVL